MPGRRRSWALVIDDNLATTGDLVRGNNWLREATGAKQLRMRAKARDPLINPTKFLATYQRKTGAPYEGEVPQTLNKLFKAMTDASNFGEKLAGTLVAASKAVEPIRTVLTKNPFINEPTVFAGDLHVKTDMSMNSRVLVLGNLIVDGSITISFEHHSLMVVGNVSCRAIEMMRAYAFVTGRLTATELFHGCCDGFTTVLGELKTRLYLIEDFQNLTIKGKSTKKNLRARHIIDNSDLNGRAAKKKLEPLLTQKVFAACTQEDDRFDGLTLFDRVTTRQSVYR